MRVAKRVIAVLVIVVESVPRTVVVVSVIVFLVVTPMILRIVTMVVCPTGVVERDAQGRRVVRVTLARMPAISVAVADRICKSDGAHTGYRTCGQDGRKRARFEQIS